MPSFEQHCAESLQLFGKPFDVVHHWLDEFAGSAEYGMRHRKKRHHAAGVQEVIKSFGTEVGPVARQHIIADLRQEGWTERDRFPKDEADYRKMGLF